MTWEAAAARAAGHVAWDRVEPLTGGRGGAHLAWRDGTPYVVKVYREDDDSGGARERSALAALDGAAGVPRLLGEGDDPALVVMSHLAGSGSLADLLLGDDAQAASDGLLAWAEALAGLHRAGSGGVRETYVAELAVRAPDLPARRLADDFASAAEHYAEVLEQLGLPPHKEALADLRSLPSRLADPADEVLSPADTCPDNNVLGDDGTVRLIDFEFAELRHRAWDVAYLRAPWPSCWCSWLLPEHAADAALDRYRRAAGTDLGPGFDDDLALATLGWRAMTPAWFVRGALDSDDGDVGPRRPARRAFVLHRLDAVAAGSSHPALAALGADLAGELRRRWGDVRLAPAPAFREGSAG